MGSQKGRSADTLYIEWLGTCIKPVLIRLNSAQHFFLFLLLSNLKDSIELCTDCTFHCSPKCFWVNMTTS